MPRQPKPFFRKQTKSWYCSLGGKQIPLGKDRELAIQKFHELMSNRSGIQSELSTLYDLSQAYLDWCKAHRKEGTYDNHRRYLKAFIESTGKRLKVADLKQHHLTKWLEATEWSDTSVNDAVSVVQRMLNWAIGEGYLRYSPIARARKPPRRRREIVYTPEQWKQIKEHATGELADFLDFLWLTGCRPREARLLSARHIQNDIVIFPADESKGERDARVLFLTEEALKIVVRLKSQHVDGPIFVNSQGRPWTKDAIKCRLTRISEKVGFRVIAYGARHSYATNALMQSVDPVSLAHLMGHKSPRMISDVYAHLSHNFEYLKQQARNAVRSPSGDEPESSQ